MNITTTGKNLEKEVNAIYPKPDYSFELAQDEVQVEAEGMKLPEVTKTPFAKNRLQIRMICKCWRPTMDKEVGIEIPKQCGASFYVGFIDARVFEQHNFISNCRVCSAAYNVFYKYNPMGQKLDVEISYREVSVKGLDIYNKYLKPYAHLNNNYDY